MLRTYQKHVPHYTAGAVKNRWMIKLHEEKGLLPTAFILGAGPCLLGGMSNGTGLGVGMDCVAAVRGSKVAAPCGTEVSLLQGRSSRLALSLNLSPGCQQAVCVPDKLVIRKKKQSL